MSLLGGAAQTFYGVPLVGYRIIPIGKLGDLKLKPIVRIKAKSRKITMTEYQADLLAMKVISYCELWKAKSAA
jgi:hypothetical protein